jgi:hypothetical protein
VRRQPRGDAARAGRPRRRGRGADADDFPRATSCAAASRPGLPLLGVRIAVRSGASRPTLGRRRPHDALEPGASVSPPPSRRARGGFISSIAARMASFDSAGRAACCCPRCRLRRGCPPIPCVSCENETRRRGLAWTPIPRLRAGSASASMWVTRSTSCTRWLCRRHGKSEGRTSIT